ncbi:MAG: N-acetylmuramoyl-L-alanine amidase [Nitrospinota bacterium]|nr:N-acetylmuramoyl-L-alanine amidase [Nitrospinota bacterium]
MKICIDPGHGGSALGAVGPGGTFEKDINLSVALYLSMGLRAFGHTVELTRSDDSTVSLQERCAIANDFSADLFLSIHCNANEDRTVTGIECYTTKGETESDRWAELIKASLMEHFPGHKDFAGKGLSEENFYVLKHTRMPAVLVELEFISNPEMEQVLKEKDSVFASAIIAAMPLNRGEE